MRRGKASVLRRDAEVAANRAYFRPPPVVPPELIRSYDFRADFGSQ
jgi:hypothetical protein